MKKRIQNKMKIIVKLHPNSSQEKIFHLEDNLYEVWIKSKPIDGKANEDLEKSLKKFFRKSVKIVSGFKSKIKIIEVSNVQDKEV